MADGCIHCNKTGECQKSKLKIDRKSCELWYECKKCGEGEHLKYIGSVGFFGFITSPTSDEIKNAKCELYCEACDGRGY